MEMRRYTLFILLLFAAALCRAQRVYVVAAGVNVYANPRVNRLRCCENDVADFCALMGRKATVYQLTGRQATRQAIVNALATVCAQATAGDAVIFFFSGHGYRGGFCPYDMQPGRNGLSYADMQTLFKQCRSGRKMVFADACFSGGLRNRRSTAPNINKNGDVLFFLSSRTNEMSQEAIGKRNGQFTRFLIRGLGGGADTNRDRTISASEIYTFVHNGVSVATRNQQHPVMWGKFDDNMPVLIWKRK